MYLPSRSDVDLVDEVPLVPVLLLPRAAEVVGVGGGVPSAHGGRGVVRNILSRKFVLESLHYCPIAKSSVRFH